MKCKSLPVCLAVLLGLAGLVWWAAYSLAPRLCLRNAADELVFFSRVPASQAFCIRFIHSVAKSPVEEWFSVRNGDIVLDSTVYQDFGAGLPHESGVGQRMTFHDGLVRISGYNRSIPQLTVRVGRVAAHTLVLEGVAPTSVGSAVLPVSADAVGAQTQVFATPDTQDRTFTAIRLDALSPAGTALTFSVERCAGTYCAPIPF